MHSIAKGRNENGTLDSSFGGTTKLASLVINDDNIQQSVTNLCIRRYHLLVLDPVTDRTPSSNYGVVTREAMVIYKLPKLFRNLPPLITLILYDIKIKIYRSRHVTGESRGDTRRWSR